MSTPLLRIVRSGSLLALLISAVAPATAEPILFTGLDPGTEPGQPHPNADRTAASFDAATWSIELVNFETAPLGDFASLLIAPGVSLSKSPFGGGVVNVPGTATDGYNTTPGGERFVAVAGGSLSVSLNFTFQQPIQAFGAYVTGAQPTTASQPPFFGFGLFITLADGTTLQIPVTASSAGGALFIGFTDAGESVREVGLSSFGRQRVSGADTFSVDDVRFGVIPEPSTLLLVSLALLALCDCGWRRRKRSR